MQQVAGGWYHMCAQLGPDPEPRPSTRVSCWDGTFRIYRACFMRGAMCVLQPLSPKPSRVLVLKRSLREIGKPKGTRLPTCQILSLIYKPLGVVLGRKGMAPTVWRFQDNGFGNPCCVYRRLVVCLLCSSLVWNRTQAQCLCSFGHGKDNQVK